MSAVFCGQVLVSTESATSGHWQSAAAQRLSVLLGRLGRPKCGFSDKGVQ